MYEAPDPPKKEIPYPWIVAGLSALSLSLLIVTITNSSTATKNVEAHILSEAQAAKRERILQSQVDKLAAELTSLRANPQNSNVNKTQYDASIRLAEQRLVLANTRINELTAELNRLRGDGKSSGMGSELGQSTLQGNYARIPELLAKAARARGGNNFYYSKARLEEVLSINPSEPGVRQELASVMAEIAKRQPTGGVDR